MSTPRTVKILVPVSFFPRSQDDRVPRFVEDQVQAFLREDSRLEITVLVPHHGDTPRAEEREGYRVVRFHYFWPRRLERLAGAGIVPALKACPALLVQVPFLFVAEFVAHLVVTAALLMLVAHLVSGVKVDNFGSAFLAAIVLGLANGFIRPLLVLVTVPVTVLTFGLFLFVINALMLQLAAALTPGLRVEGCGAALLGSLLLSILNVEVAAIIGGF